MEFGKMEQKNLLQGNSGDADREKTCGPGRDREDGEGKGGMSQGKKSAKMKKGIL